MRVIRRPNKYLIILSISLIILLGVAFNEQVSKIKILYSHPEMMVTNSTDVTVYDVSTRQLLMYDGVEDLVVSDKEISFKWSKGNDPQEQYNFSNNNGIKINVTEFTKTDSMVTNYIILFSLAANIVLWGIVALIQLTSVLRIFLPVTKKKRRINR